MRKFTILIHGGAGTITGNSSDKCHYLDALRRIISEIYKYTSCGSDLLSAVDIVEFAVKLLEDEPLFNAGRGAVFNENGEVELESSIMDGKNLQCGSVSLIKTLKNPISAARVVMDKTAHNYLVGQQAETFLKLNGLQGDEVENSYFYTKGRKDQLIAAQGEGRVTLDHHGKEEGAKGTVGCVCMLNGSVAAGTSTGGMTNKMGGRIGDSPIIGAGTYANNLTCAVSATGKGEEFMRHLVAYDISARMGYCGQDILSAATATVFDRLPKDSGGVIAVDRLGRSAMVFNSSGMYRAMVGEDGTVQIGIWEDIECFQIR